MNAKTNKNGRNVVVARWYNTWNDYFFTHKIIQFNFRIHTHARARASTWTRISLLARSLTQIHAYERLDKTLKNIAHRNFMSPENPKMKRMPTIFQTIFQNPGQCYVYGF